LYRHVGPSIAEAIDMLSPSEIEAFRRRGRANVLATFESRHNAFTLGWCAAFVQYNRVYVVQRAQVRS
jgi:hypothetical protein